MLCLKGNRNRQASVIGRARQHEAQTLVRYAPGPHEDGPPPPKIRVMDREPHPARDPKVRAPKRVGPADKRLEVRLELQVVEGRPQVLIVHPGQRIVDLAGAVPDRPRLQVPGHGHGRGREDHVPEVARGERGLKPGPPVRRDVQLRVLILGQAAGQAGAAPDVAREHLVGAVVDRIALVLGLGFESGELLASKLEYRDYGLRCVISFHGGRGLVLDMLELRLRGIAGTEQGPVDEWWEGDVEPTGHVGPCVDEV